MYSSSWKTTYRHYSAVIWHQKWQFRQTPTLDDESLPLSHWMRTCSTCIPGRWHFTFSKAFQQLSASLLLWFPHQLSLSTGYSQGCILSPLQFALHTYDCTPIQPTNTTFKYADDTIVVGPISDGDETAYKVEVENLSCWCSENGLKLNVRKMKELLMASWQHRGPGKEGTAAPAPPARVHSDQVISSH